LRRAMICAGDSQLEQERAHSRRLGERVVALEAGERHAARALEEVRGQLEVSHLCTCIGSPCLRHCVHGASIDRALRPPAARARDPGAERAAATADPAEERGDCEPAGGSQGAAAD
jgi:hypothetical protein